jgi:hypothetical protein
MAIVPTAICDAWVAYDDLAVGTRLGGSLRRPEAARTQSNQDVSRRDRHTLAKDVKLFFAVSNAVMDAFIACWEAKRHDRADAGARRVARDRRARVEGGAPVPRESAPWSRPSASRPHSRVHEHQGFAVAQWSTCARPPATPRS